ncbi:hypothetical protein LTR78_007369 [Recurvomyces mirabilis]|uniref:Trafficking protein particle complex subunit BET3 n=1 Tax=Recurvomyces mirabilis TaxID=574656 RepID=A0AAE1BYQ1_9PEZI|nr:hypothetical protein LTR78_007369 [Recurvomyces mirabilis]KAK5155043.1 hypothetical protein LTS14_005998 [Recurvomyces mirabilis]
MASSKAARMGEEVWKTRTEKINLEVLTLTYGTLVSQLTHDLRDPATNIPDYAAINTELDRMGHSIGLRLIEDFLAKTSSAGPAPCNNFRETAEMIAKVGFKIFLNVTPRVENWDKEGRSFGLVFEEMPVSEFVELPDDGRAQEELWFLNLFCGVVKGALEMVQMQVKAEWVSDVLRGDDTTEMRVTLIRYIEDEMPPDDE